MTAIALSPDRPVAADRLRPVAFWLLACAFMVFAMAVIGAVTRLTGSGLSIAEWRPIMGALPPLSEAEWSRVFQLYQTTPEYRLKNAGMSLDAFKAIFFWEWLHRLWGRLIGLVFAAPLAVFWWQGRLDGPLARRLLGLLALGGLQGVVGWYMVKSGLVDRPSVSHYRLALHLGLAVLVYALLLRQALVLLGWQDVVAAPASLRRHAGAALALAAVTMVWGALVAGLDAGFIYNSFPSMAGDLLPPEAWALRPRLVNPVENPVLVQFLHRWLALTTAAVVLVLAWRARRHGGPVAPLAAACAVAVLVQVGLGVATLLLVVPTGLAAAHQAGALVLLGLLVWLGLVLGRDRRRPRPA